MEISEHETARGKRQHDISPETLFKQLAAKRELGEKAEKIAYEYELERVRKEGCRQPKKHVDHVSRRVTNAGYDIVSTFNKKRYIEVKGTSRKQPQIYLTRNEYNFLKKHGKEAYLYVVVFIQDKDPQMRRIPDPIPWLEEHSSLATELYFATLPGETKG
jgi:hypothetical protein